MTAGSLPAGLTLSSGGIIAGTPTGAGSSAISVTVSDGSGQMASAAFTLQILALPVITKTALLDASLGSPYSDTLTATIENVYGSPWYLIPN